RSSMKLLRFFHKLFAIVVALALITIVPFAEAQPPSTSVDGPNDVKKTVMAPRVKPQVIYHLPRSSNDAAALHAQAKAENNMLPIDSSMPTSLQLARSNANAAAQTPPPGPSAQNQLQDMSGRKRHVNSSVARTKSAKAHTPGKAPGAKTDKKH
ncbi:MAG: hypothetical protein M3N12_06820, partial [Verrucomicrobiota bacterium]|nr:hypothetical protein [Verrucomicrobiota bacterium]